MKRRIHVEGNTFFLALVCLTVLLSGVFGYCIGRETVDVEHTEQAKNYPHLSISAVVDENAGFTDIRIEPHRDGVFGDITYYNLTNVSVEIDEELVHLENALNQHLISLEEIFAYARLDSKAGFCLEAFTSKNGLAAFTYEYPGYVLEMVYDVYETPGLKQYVINDMKLYAKGSDIHTLYTYEENGERIDKEDWGLLFETDLADANGISIRCSQSGGQQIGELTVESFNIVHADDWEVILKTNQDSSISKFDPIGISRNSETEINIDWLDCYGPLEKGNYYIVLQIHDTYDIADVHSLMRNYYDTQYYQIAFSIA